MARSRFHLHWLCAQPTPYNDHLFSAIAAEPDFSLCVHFARPSLPSHPWRSQELQGFRARTYQLRLGVDWHIIGRALQEPEAVFVVGGWHELTAQVLIGLLILLRRRFILWADTPNINRRRPRLKAALRARWLQVIFRHAACVMGAGRPALEALSAMGCPLGKLVNFPYFVDLEKFAPSARAKESDTPRSRERQVFLAMGRLHPDKGYDVALRAWGRLANRDANASCLLRIAGEGPEADGLRELAAAEGIAERVEFVGWLEASDVSEFLQGGDVFIHPARYEPYGVVVLEAMASGLAVIGSDVTGAVRDRICQGKNGLVCRAGDVDSLAEQMEFLLRHPDRVVSMGFCARKSAEEWPVSKGVMRLRDVVNTL